MNCLRKYMLLGIMVVCLSWFGGAKRCLAEKIAIAVPNLSLASSVHKQFAFEKSHHWAPYFEVLRSASTPPLTSALPSRGEKTAKVNSLSFVQSLRSNPESNETHVVLRAGSTFSNGEELHAVDAVTSFSRCIEAETPTVEVRGVLEFSIIGDAREALQLLSSCPIFESDSSQVFGPLLGNANFFVGLGPYEVSHIKPGVRISLKKVKDSWTNARQHSVSSQFVDEIELRMIADPRRALTALRFGSVDLIFSDDSEIQQLASNDETLSTGECRGFEVVYRKGLSLQCDDVRWVSKLRYLG